MERHGGKCARCGSTENLTMDHIIPRAKGGRNCLENLQLLCFGCNQAKADELTAMEYAWGAVA